MHAELAEKVKKVRDEIRDFNKMLVQKAPPEEQVQYAELADRLHYAERDCTAWLKAHDQN